MSGSRSVAEILSEHGTLEIEGIDRMHRNFRCAALWYCITYAYTVKSYQVSGPDWLKDVRYDIVAKGRAATSSRK